MEQNLENRAQVCGCVMEHPTFSHRLYGETFYLFTLRVPRLSDCADYLPITASERLMGKDVRKGAFLLVEGQVRSYNKIVHGTNRLIVTLFARQIAAVDSAHNVVNTVRFTGHICKPPVYRMTPFRREITDLLLAVNRSYGKSDYIPAIAWGRNARFAGTLSVGDCVRLFGRFQSRTYQKRLLDGQIEEKIAYEVSIAGMEKVRCPKP